MFALKDSCPPIERPAPRFATLAEREFRLLARHANRASRQPDCRKSLNRQPT